MTKNRCKICGAKIKLNPYTYEWYHFKGEVIFEHKPILKFSIVRWITSPISSYFFSLGLRRWERKMGWRK